MDKQLEWEYYYNKKDNWKHDAFQRIKKRLLLIHDNAFVRFNSSMPNHLAVVYGRSQSGKTTLILTMIGIKQDQNTFQKVYETLRAGMPKGNSSTSTAIIYSKSANDKYGYAYVNLNSQENEITYFDNEKDLEKKLIQIRKEVEENCHSLDTVLHIHIPKKYFDNSNNNISILDMPGVGSKNTKEAYHVTALMNRYIPIASVCIVVWTPDEINSLKTDVILNETNWTQMTHKFILVLVRAYSNQLIRSHWEKNSLKSNFYDFVVNEYTKALKSELGETNQIAIYPIELGESYNKLCCANTSIKETRDIALKKINNAILSRNSDKLASAIHNLKEKINADSDAITKGLEEDANYNKQKIEETQKKLELLKKYKAKLLKSKKRQSQKNKLERLNTLESKILELSVYSDNIYNIFTARVEELGYHIHQPQKRGFYYRKEDDECSDYGRVFNLIHEIVFSQCETYVNQYKQLEKSFRTSEDNSIFSEISIKISILVDQTLSKAESILNKYSDILSPAKTLDRIYLDDIKECCDSISIQLIQVFQNERQNVITQINNNVSKIQSHLKKVQRIEEENEINISKYEVEIASLKNERSKIEEKKKQCEDNKEQDEATLAMYQSYVKEAFETQRQEIIDSINSSESSDERIMYFLLLGIIEEEFYKINEVNSNEPKSSTTSF